MQADGRGFLTRAQLINLQRVYTCIICTCTYVRVYAYVRWPRGAIPSGALSSATSQRCRNDVADDNAPLGIAPLGHRTYAMIRALRNGAAADIKHFASKLHFPNYIHTPKESNYLQNECSKGHLQGEALGQRSVSIPVCIDI